MPDRLYFTDSDEANALIASDPMALLVGFALDQQVTVQKAFAGPLALRERLGALDAATLAPPISSRCSARSRRSTASPGAMAQRVHALAVHVRDTYDGDAARIWTEAADGDALRANLAALPGFGEMKVKALGAVLAKRFGVAAAEELVPWHPTLGDVDSPQALADYQAAKRVHKAEWSKARRARSRSAASVRIAAGSRRSARVWRIAAGRPPLSGRTARFTGGLAGTAGRGGTELHRTAPPVFSAKTRRSIDKGRQRKMLGHQTDSRLSGLMTESPGAVVVDSTLETVLRALSSAPGQLAGGDDAPVMVVVLARETQSVADTLGVARSGCARPRRPRRSRRRPRSRSASAISSWTSAAWTAGPTTCSIRRGATPECPTGASHRPTTPTAGAGR